VGVAALVVGCTTHPGSEARSPAEPGAAGVGHDYYPHAGNGGYTATDYAVTLRYDPAEPGIDAEATIRAKADKALSRFNLDLRGLQVESVTVNERPAEFSRSGDFELRVTPEEPLDDGERFRTHVVYSGTPRSSAGELGSNGWNRDETGAMYVLGEPHSASYWYPVNDTPRNKATFELNVTVPTGWSAVSIGTLVDKSTSDGWTTWHWSEDTPVAPYLTTLAVDRFTIDRDSLDDGTPVLSAYAPGATQMRSKGDRVGEVLTFLASKFGPYPQRAAGGIYLDDHVGYSLETQTRPAYTSEVGMGTIVHELTHQWYGNSVTIRSWADICLAECFASYATWMWDAHEDGIDLDSRYRATVEGNRNNGRFWRGELYDMGAGNEFTAVYSKGPLAVHALRERIGEDDFATLLRQWHQRHETGHADWPEFENFVSELTGEDLTDFFDAWFHSTEIPPDKHLYP